MVLVDAERGRARALAEHNLPRGIRLDEAGEMRGRCDTASPTRAATAAASPGA